MDTLHQTPSQERLSDHVVLLNFPQEMEKAMGVPDRA